MHPFSCRPHLIYPPRPPCPLRLISITSFSERQGRIPCPSSCGLPPVSDASFKMKYSLPKTTGEKLPIFRCKCLSLHTFTRSYLHTRKESAPLFSTLHPRRNII